MEKLERVLVAEDDAREALADATVEAAGLKATAADQARRIEDDIARATDDAVASHRVATLSAARAEADRVSRDAAAVRDATLSAARERLDDAVRRAAASLEA